MSSATTRQQKRAPVTLKIKFKSSSLEEFVERYAVDISQGGIFIRTKKPLEVGTPLRFEFQLKDASPLITGEGTVVWTREYDPGRTGLAPGMGVRFDRLPSDSQRVLGQILTAKKKQPTAPDPSEEFVDSPTKVAPRAVIAGLAEGSRDSQPPPQFGGDEHAPLDAFDEATKVGLLDELVAKTAEPDPDDEPVLTSAERMPTDVDGPLGIEKEAPKPIAVSPPASFPEADDLGELPDPPTEKKLPAADFVNVPTAVGMAPPPPSVTDNAKTIQSMSPPSPANVAAAIERSKDIDLPAREPSAPAVPAAVSTPLAAAAASRADRIADDERTQTTELPPKASTGSSAALMAVAVLIVIGAAGGGYWLWTKQKGSEKAAVPADKVETPAKVATGDGDGTGDGTGTDVEPTKPDVPAAPTVTAVVASDTEGATATIVGSDKGGATPFTFEGLEEGKTYKVKIAAAGHFPKEIEVAAGGEAPPSVTLDPKPRVIHVESTPAGATVYVNGRRKGVAPLDVEIKDALAKRDQWRIELRRSGYKNKSETVLASATWAEEDMRMLRNVDLELVKRQVIVRKPDPTPGDGDGDKSGDGDGDGDGDKSGDGDGDGTGSGTPTSGDGDGDKSGDGDGDGDKSGDGDGDKSGDGDGDKGTGSPTPDWAKDKDKTPAPQPPAQ